MGGVTGHVVSSIYVPVLHSWIFSLGGLSASWRCDLTIEYGIWLWVRLALEWRCAATAHGVTHS